MYTIIFTTKSGNRERVDVPNLQTALDYARFCRQCGMMNVVVEPRED